MKSLHRIGSGVAVAATLALQAVASPAFAQAPLPAIFAAHTPGAGIYIDQTYLSTIWNLPNFKLIDVRSATAYQQGHIPGAFSIPNNLLNETREGITSEVRSIEERQAVFAAAGLSYDDILVIYGDGSIGKAFIAFDQSGFENLHILNGGVSDWVGELSTVATIPTPSNFELTRAKIDIVSKEYVLERIDDPNVFILDARQNVADYEAGYIPGSFHIPRGVYFDGDALKPLDGLVEYLASLGITPDTEIITTCGAGPSASDLLTVLRDLGYTNIRLYDGSWQEWVLDPDTPKARVG